MHVLTLLRHRYQELYCPEHLVHTSGAPLDPEEGLGVPVEVETGDDVAKEVGVVGGLGLAEDLGQAVGAGAVAAGTRVSHWNNV